MISLSSSTIPSSLILIFLISASVIIPGKYRSMSFPSMQYIVIDFSIFYEISGIVVVLAGHI